MRFHVITLFKDSIDSYVNESILGRARGEGKISVFYYNPRDFTPPLKGKKKPGYVDGKPYGGGPGMVLEALPLIKAAEKALLGKKKTKVILFSPSGKQFTTAYAKKLAKEKEDIVLIAGRYEGVDARVKKILKAEEISVGPYVLTGGEIPAAVLIDSVSRQIPGVLGNFDSREETRVSTSKTYTRPEVLEHKGKKYRVPKVLLSGDHKKIEAWKRKN